MSGTVLRRFSTIGLALAGVCGAVVARVAYTQNPSSPLQFVPQEIVAQRLQRVLRSNADREVALKKIFDEAGCPEDEIQEEIVKRKDPPNLICTLPGSTNSLIIIGAHLDHAEEGTGAVDDWSGASMLPSVYQALRGAPRKHTFVFIGFTDEEEGLWGSAYYVKHLSKDRLPDIKAMVNLECLGLGPTEVWARIADKALLGALVNVAQSMHVELDFVNMGEGIDDDTHPFREKKLPVITLHSVTQKTLFTLHSDKDNLAAVHVDQLYESYQVVTRYLATIDQSLP